MYGIYYFLKWLLLSFFFISFVSIVVLNYYENIKIYIIMIKYYKIGIIKINGIDEDVIYEKI